MIEPEDLKEDHKLSEPKAAMLLGFAAGLALLVATVTSYV